MAVLISGEDNRRQQSVKSNGIIQKAKAVLDANWNGRFTIPSPVLYPHQWSWDSAFIAIGNSYADTSRAVREMKHLFSAQWENGMVPHIVFNETAKSYYPAGDFYGVRELRTTKDDYITSCLIQPPVHAIAAYYIYKNAQEGQRERVLEFLRWIYPKLLDFHRYLTTYRDPEGTGLVTVFHPWESGLDNLPVWDEPLARLKIEKSKIPKFPRLDIKALGGAKETRERDETYGRLIYLINRMKELRYDEEKLNRDFPFKVKDIMCSCAMYVANKHLLMIGEIIQDDKNSDIIRQWMRKTEFNFFKYFTPTGKVDTLEADDLYNYDLRKEDWIRRRTVLSLLPVYSGIIPREKIDVVVNWINHSHYCGAGNCFAPVLPSTDLDESYFIPQNYWRGPVWININWMIYYGLRNYGFYHRAEEIRQGILKLVEKSGFREYFNPFTGEGLGGTNFGWTASLVIDLFSNADNDKPLNRTDVKDGADEYK